MRNPFSRKDKGPEFTREAKVRKGRKQQAAEVLQ